MLDLIYIGAIVLFFVLAIGYIGACSLLGGEGGRK